MRLLRSVIDIPRALLRRSYDWTIRWADTSQALIALFLIALAESSFFPIPPDVLLIAIVATQPTRWLLATVVCSAGSLLGAAVGYAIGFGLMATVGEPIIGFYGAEHHWDQFVVLPIPFKVATIASGAIEMPFVSFLVISLIGRTTRFLLVAGILRLFGTRIRRALEHNFDLAALLFFTLLIGGFLILKLF